MSNLMPYCASLSRTVPLWCVLPFCLPFDLWLPSFGALRRGSADQPGPSACPANRLFVPAPLRSEVLQWSHSSKLTGHPGAHRTREFLQQQFWWSILEEEVHQFVKSCPTCNQHKPFHQAPVGHLHPLPIPSRLWSHISLDFVTDLPPLAGNSAILTIVDRFSKMTHFVPLQKLPICEGDC